MTAGTILLACLATTAFCMPSLTTITINGEPVNVRLAAFSDNPAVALVATAVLPPFVVAMSIADIVCCAVRLGSGGDFPCPKTWAPSELPVNEQLNELATEISTTVLLATLYTIAAYLTLGACRLAWAAFAELMVLLDKRIDSADKTIFGSAANDKPRRASMRMRTRASARATTPSESLATTTRSPLAALKGAEVVVD